MSALALASCGLFTGASGLHAGDHDEDIPLPRRSSSCDATSPCSDAGEIITTDTATLLCLSNNGGCSPNATCTQTGASRTCHCHDGFSGDGITCRAQSCKQLLAAQPSAKSGVQLLDADGTGPLPPVRVYCDMSTDDGGWTLVHKNNQSSTN